ncbi:MAG: hypothetical protein HRF46_12870 [Acidobacteriota bacterium]
MKTTRGVVGSVALGVWLATLGCGGQGERVVAPGGDARAAANLQEHFDLTPETVLVKQGARALRRTSADGSTWFLDVRAVEADQLVPGKVLLIPGVDVGKVGSVRRSGDEVEVTVEPVRIVEVIRNGTLEWGPDDLDPARGFPLVWGEADRSARRLYPSLDGTFPRGLAPEWSLLRSAWAGPAPPSGPPRETDKFTFSIEGYRVVVSIQPHQAQFNFQRDVGSESAGSLWAGGSVVAHWGEPRSTGSIQVSNSKVTRYLVKIPVNGFIEVQVSSKSPKARTFPDSALVEIPMQYVIPFAVYGVPAYVSFGVKYLIQPSIAAKETGVGLSLRYDFSGTLGFDYQSDAVEQLGELMMAEPSNPLAGIEAVPSVGSLALLFAVQAPRIGVGVGRENIARAGAFVDLVHSFGVAVAGATSAVPCRQLTVSRVAGVGLEFEIGPESFRDVIENFKRKTKLGGEVAKVELYRLDRHFFSPHIKACDPRQ